MAPEQYRGARRPDHLGIRASRLPPGGYEASMNMKGPRAEWRHAEASPNWIDLPYREARGFEGAINRERDALGLRAIGIGYPYLGTTDLQPAPPAEGPRAARLRGASAVAIDAAGLRYVADTEHTGSWCSIRRRQGQDLARFGREPGAFQYPRGLALDQAGTRSGDARPCPDYRSAAPQLACLARGFLLSGTHRFLRRTPLGVFLSRAAAVARTWISPPCSRLRARLVTPVSGSWRATFCAPLCARFVGVLPRPRARSAQDLASVLPDQGFERAYAARREKST